MFEREAEHSLGVFVGAQLATQRAVQGEVGKIVIGFQSTAGLSVVPQLLKQLGQRYPEAEVTLREMGMGPQRTAWRQGEIDVGIMYTLPDMSLLTTNSRQTRWWLPCQKAVSLRAGIRSR